MDDSRAFRSLGDLKRFLAEKAGIIECDHMQEKQARTSSENNDVKASKKEKG